jgi:hypothetical protein
MKLGSQCMTREVWKSISGYSCLYEISSLGRVRRASDSRKAKAGFILKPHFNGHRGYEYIDLCKFGVSRKYLVSRLVCRAFHGPCPPGKNCNHIDGNPSNNSASNLEWTTQSENCTHSYRVLGRKGYSPSGPLNGRSKEYIITLPTGEDIPIKGLKDFSRKHGLSTTALLTLARGHHKGYKCRFP